MSLQLWEWVGDTTISKPVNRRYTAAPTSTTYGAVIDQDMIPAEKRSNFRLRGMSLTECQTLEATLFGTISVPVRGGTYTIADKRGTSTTGTVLSFSYALIDGSALYTASIQMRI